MTKDCTAALHEILITFNIEYFAKVRIIALKRECCDTFSETSPAEAESPLVIGVKILHRDKLGCVGICRTVRFKFVQDAVLFQALELLGFSTATGDLTLQESFRKLLSFSIRGRLSWNNAACFQDFDRSDSSEECVNILLELTDLFVRETRIIREGEINLILARFDPLDIPLASLVT